MKLCTRITVSQGLIKRVYIILEKQVLSLNHSVDFIILRDEKEISPFRWKNNVINLIPDKTNVILKQSQEKSHSTYTDLGETRPPSCSLL